MPHDPPEFVVAVSASLGWYYAAVGGLNFVATWRAVRGRKFAAAVAWMVLALAFAGLAAAAFTGRPPTVPEGSRTFIRAVLGPVTFTATAFGAFVMVCLLRRLLVIPAVAWTLLNASLVFMGISLANPNFAAIVTRPDNVPIVAMVYLLGFCLWLGASQAVANDDRLRRGLGPIEKEYAGTVLVWPDLVYIELIIMLVVTTVLVVWSVGLKAPLEPPANPAVTPNPSKAPWYFAGLQEMLVYFDASIAGVIVPGLIIFGLAAIPYLDCNPQGSGYYSFASRRFSCVTFLFGFFQLWILLILIGVFFRGPNWNFVSPYEPPDPHKLVVLDNVKLSEYFWGRGLGRPLPQPPAESSGLVRLGHVAWREIAGVAALGIYFGLLPVILGLTLLGGYRRRMGLLRYGIMVLLLLMMFAIPLKMILRWTLNLNSIVSMQEYNVFF